MATTVFGVVGADGSIVSGSGNFTVVNTASGVFSISFNAGFTAVPAVVASQGGNFPQPSNRDGAVVGILTNDTCTIITGDDEGNFVSRQFSFIATGN